MMIGAGLITLLIIGVAVLVFRPRSGPTTPPAAGGSGPSSASPRPVVVAPATIRATASSTLADDGSITYGIRNTLDSDRSTAWNSDGKRVGVTLTYRFSQSIRLGRITVLNGYAKTPKLFAENARVATFSVRTDQGTRRWSVKDTQSAQTLNADLGRTSKVVLAVDGVYPGAKFDDLALTDITFYAVG